MIDLLQVVVRKLHSERDKLTSEVLETPPPNYEKFMKVVGEYHGLSKAINVIDVILRGNEDT